MSVDVSAVARVLGITTNYKDLRGNAVVFLPQAVAVVGQGATASTYTTTPVQSSSATDVGTAYGFGSPLHLAAQKLFPINGDGIGTIPCTFYPLQDAGTGVAASGDITPTGTATETAEIRVFIGEVRSDGIVIEDNDTVALACDKIHAAVSGILAMPVTSTDSTTSVDFVSKWLGASANDIKIRIEGTVAGMTFGITQPSGGLVNPDVDDALNQITTRWETMVLNCMEPGDTTTLDKIKTHGEGRWGELERKPYVAFTGRVAAEPPLATQESDARKTDRINGFLVAPDSGELPFVVAARQLARIAKRGQQRPSVRLRRSGRRRHLAWL